MNGLYLLLGAISVATAYVVPIEDCIPNEECMNVIGCPDTLHLPDDSNCHKFFKCAAGRACPMDCPKFDGDLRLVFNPLTQTCDWPGNVPNRPNCGQGPPTTPSSTTPSSTTPSSTTPSSTTPSSTTPSSTTPSSTTPSSTTPSSTTPSPTTPSSTTPSSTTTRDPRLIPTECNNITGRKRLQYEHDCTHYYEMVGTKKVLKECNIGLFNCVIEACDRPENVPWCT